MDGQAGHGVPPALFFEEAVLAAWGFPALLASKGSTA